MNASSGRDRSPFLPILLSARINLCPLRRFKENRHFQGSVETFGPKRPRSTVSLRRAARRPEGQPSQPKGLKGEPQRVGLNLYNNCYITIKINTVFAGV